MDSLIKKLQRSRGFVAGVLLGLCVVTPTFAASFSFDTVQAADWLLMGSLVLLGVALALRLMRSRDATDATPDDIADLRWWRNPDAASY